ncbi:MAG: HAMP domain-containing histidine kinase [Opitutae bacterium]|nr:HAMP domain-containing histidine kinase [Opitutae bacterium]
MTDAALSRQANRLRFDDPAQEARFRADHDERSLRQWRIAAGLGAAAVVAIGLFYQINNAASARVESFGRFALVLPWFALMFAFTFWRRQRPHLQLIGALCCTAAVSFYFLTQCFAVATQMRLTYSLTVSLFSLNGQFLVAVAVAVPLSTRAVGVTLFITTAIGYLFIRAAYPSAARDFLLHQTIIQQVATVGLISLVLIAVTWARERLQRLSFAQQEQLAAMNAELARLNAEKNEFMAIAAHDLRAPLASVGGTAEHLAPRAADPALARGFALIADQSRRMLALVNDYLGAHAAESGQLPVRLTQLELGQIARDSAQRHTATAAAKRQRIELGGIDAGVHVEADATLLAQVIDNFVTNALKFSPPDSTVRLEVQTAPGHPRARLAVVDQGPGIAADEHGKLFRKFGRASTRPTGGESSHGLGLAVAKRLAEAMGGSVGCDSEIGRGATFWIELPRHG